MDKVEFFNMISKPAQEACKKINFPASLLMTHAAIESNFGKILISENNLFSFEEKGSSNFIIHRVYSKANDGVMFGIDKKIKVFSSILECFDYWCLIVSGKEESQNEFERKIWTRFYDGWIKNFDIDKLFKNFVSTYYDIKQSNIDLLSLREEFKLSWYDEYTYNM